MADAAAAITDRQAKENSIREFFDAEDRELDLMVWRFLRIRYPHQSTAMSEIDRDIATERRRKCSQ